VKLRLTEDTPGEIDNLTDDELAKKLVDGMAAVSRHIFEGRRQRLAIEKGGTGGEIDALETVVEDIGKSFNAALEKIRKDALKGLEA
jgi:hypothetical protein